MTTKTKRAVHICWMIRRDMPAVLEIESDIFGTAAWTEEEFIKALRQRNNIGMVAEIDDETVGYMIYELRKTSLQLDNLAVSREHQRSGIGKTMIAKLKGKLNADRRTSISVLVRETNLDGCMFFQSLGFIGSTEYQPYIDNDEDGIEFIFRHAWDES